MRIPRRGILILVTMGTGPSHTREILEAMDEMAPRLGDEVVMQVGPSDFRGKNTRCFSFVSEKEINDIFDSADVFIGLPNVGTMLNAVNRSKPIVMVFDLPEYRIKFRSEGEAMRIAKYLEDRGMGIVSWLPDLEENIRKAKQMKVPEHVPNTELADWLSDFLDDFDRKRKTR